MPGKKKNPKGGAKLQIGGNVSVTHGDIVAGDKNINVDKGGVLIGGHVQGSNIVTGDGNQVGNKQAEQEAFFSEILKRIDRRPNTSREAKEDLKANVAEIKAEVEKGEQADESLLARRVRNIQRIAPDIGKAVSATIPHPSAGPPTSSPRT